MRDKGILKILAISVILAVVVSSVTVFSAANLDIGISEKGIDEGGGKGVISLVPPPFIGVAGASESEVSGAGTNFLEEEAGDEDEKCLADENHYSLYKPSIPKYKLNEQIIQAAGNEKSNNTFSIHGNISLLWSYIDDKKEAKVDFDALDDVNGDGIVDVLLYDRNSGGKVLVVSGKDGSTIWSKICPIWIESIERFDDVNGDGINDAIAYGVRYESYKKVIYNTIIIIEVLNGNNGERIWSEEISHFGVGGCFVQVRGTQEMRGCYGSLDLNGDGIEDILVEVVGEDYSMHLHPPILIGTGKSREYFFYYALNGKNGSGLWKIGCECDSLFYGWGDVTDDGIDDLVISCSGLETQSGKLYVINGSNRFIEWVRSFSFSGIGGMSGPRLDDFDGDGRTDIILGTIDFSEDVSNVFVFKGTNGHKKWSKSWDNKIFLRLCNLSDFTGDGINEQCLEFGRFTPFTLKTVEIQVLSGEWGSLIWRKEVNVFLPGHSKDLNGDNVGDILLPSCTDIGENRYLCSVSAISGIDGSEIWKSSFVTEGSEGWVGGLFVGVGGEDDLNGDGITDPLFICTGKLILINGKNGSEIGNVECPVSSVWTGDDFNKDGIKDILLGTGKGVYLFIIELMNDTIPPVIADVSVINVTNNSAVITWRTDEFADSVVKYGENSTVYTEMCTDELFVKEHSTTLMGLSPGITYYFVVNSTDRSENSAESLEYSFTTAKISEKINSSSMRECLGGKLVQKPQSKEKEIPITEQNL